MSRTEIKIAGYGGQGVITLSKMIAAAAILYQDGITATQTEAYGAQARGGACWAEVVISDEGMIDYPRAIVPVDVLMVFSEEAARNYKNEVKKDGIAIFDPLTVRPRKFKVKAKRYAVPANQIATEELKMSVTQNSIMFGAFIGITGIIDKASAEECVRNFVPSKFIEINLDAFRHGLEIGKKLKEEASS
ncbi:MAG: 2-oxoacid:acceptor oxidoreductase family protein [Candidatus Helarchaeota archaeon]